MTTQTKNDTPSTSTATTADTMIEKQHQQQVQPTSTGTTCTVTGTGKSTSRPSSAATTNTSSSANNNNNNNIHSSPPAPQNKPLPPHPLVPPLSPSKQQNQQQALSSGISHEQSSSHSYDSYPSSSNNQQQSPKPIFHNRSKTVTTSNLSPMKQRNGNQELSNNDNINNNYNGVIQGMEMLEKQQLKWEEQERRKRIVEGRRNTSYNNTNNNNSSTRDLNKEQQIQWKYGDNNPNHHNNNLNQQQLNYLQPNATMTSGSSGSINAGGGGGGVGTGYYSLNSNRVALPPIHNGLPQDQYLHPMGGGNENLHHNYQLSRGGSGSSVPKTVHVNGDCDDVSESLMDEGGHTGGGTGIGSGHKEKKKDGMKRVTSLGKFLKSTQNLKRNISDLFSNDPTDNNVSSSRNNNTINYKETSICLKPILFGYLQKLGRDGKWQKRYFESDGVSLLYYKNNKRTRVLATLDLLFVGRIQMDSTDPAGCTFLIEVKGRNYYLCADTKERARDWVITLNRVKEARMEIGGLELIKGGSGVGGNSQVNNERSAVDDDDDQVEARIVIKGTRRRLKGLGKDDFSEMERSLDGQTNSVERTGLSMSPQGTGSMGSYPNSPGKQSMIETSRNSSNINVLSASKALHNSVTVRWTKRRNAMENWTRRVSRWAKRVTMIRCIIKDDVVYCNPDVHHQQIDNVALPNTGYTESDYNHQEEPFTDYGSYNYHPELYAERQYYGSNFSEEVQNITSKESMDTSAMSAPPRMSSWKPPSCHRMQEVIVQEESGGSSIQSSSGRITPNHADDESGTCIT